MTREILERIYAGFLGMNVGIRLGAPVEASVWSYERIRDTYGEITGYVKEYRNFAADDDANGPYYFLRALWDDAADREPCPQDIGRAWLNYAREGVGMFWWGGYGRSTEHTAYLNLKNGVSAPRSGSAEQNGRTLSEQIGGQIFIDTWGLVSPGDPAAAARRAAVSASVSHDGEGLEGARFIAAAIALAFDLREIGEIVERAKAFCAPDSRYRAVVDAVTAFHRAHLGDWRACREMLAREWGYDRYPGACHIIPNAGVCVLAMLYGEGDFARTVEIAAMCGWDTDCNAGNVGTVLGVMTGLGGIPARYRDPVGDAVVLSGVSGYLNMLDLPTYAKELALHACRLKGETPPRALTDAFRREETYFDFELPGATHGIRVSDPFFSRVEQTYARSYAGEGSLCILVDRAARFEGSRVFYKPFYRRSDFSDERYSPVFSPRAYSGQTLSFMLLYEHWEGADPVLVRPYCRLSYSGELLCGPFVRMEPEVWTAFRYTLPDSKGEPIDEVGFMYEGNCKGKTLGKLYLDEFAISGKADYRVALAPAAVEFGCVTPFSQDHGAWCVEEGRLHALSTELSQAFTGSYFTRDVAVSAQVAPMNGAGHMLLARAQGTRRGYMAGLTDDGRVAILKNDFGLSALAEAAYPWETGRTYELTLTARGETLTLYIDGKDVLTARDGAFAYGMVGFAKPGMGRTLYGDLSVREL